MNDIIMPVSGGPKNSKTIKHEGDNIDFQNIEEGKEITEKKSRWKRLFR
jgi:hypothetical protein